MDTPLQPTRQETLLRVLRRAPGPVAGAALAAALDVSTRSVRQYVRDLNALAGGAMIEASHLGYVLDERLAQRFERDRPDRSRADTPLQRLYYIARRLVTSTDGEDVFALADMLFMSESTIEGDLSKVRTLLREFDLVLERDGGRLRITGSEADQRRLVRQILLDSAQGVSAAGLAAAVQEYHAYDLEGLTALIVDALTGHGIDLNEYALNDLALHAVIAVDRISGGHGRPDSGPIVDDPHINAAVEALCAALEPRYGIAISPAERTSLARLIAARATPSLTDEPGVADPYLRLVQQIMRQLSERYLLDIDDDAFALNLSLHVRNLVARARSGQHARNPLRTSFKQSHPLIHELAVFVASEIEAGAGVELDEDEIVFLSLHLGAYLQKTLDEADRVTITCVVPRYYDVHRAFDARLAEHLGAQVTIDETITTLHHDWSTITSDLIVSTIDMPTSLRAEVVLVSPVPTTSELDLVAAAARTVRSRKSAARIRWTLSELLDPRLFVRVPSISQADALERMCSTLVDEGVVGPAFLQDVLERERLSPTAFGGSIAVPHSLRMDADRTAISILISDEPIAWSGSRVQLVALFALSPTGRHVFRDVLDTFIATLANPVRMAEVVAGGTSYEGFVRTVTQDGA